MEIDQPTWRKPLHWLNLVATIWLDPGRFFEMHASFNDPKDAKALLLPASLGTILSTLLFSIIPILALSLLSSRIGWIVMIAGALLGLSVGIGSAVFLFAGSPIQVVDLVLLGTGFGLISAFATGLHAGFTSGQRLDGFWGACLGLMIGLFSAFLVGFRSGYAGSSQDKTARIYPLAAAAMATLYALDLDSVTIPAYFIALLASMVVALPAASLGVRCFQWRMGSKR